MPPSRVGLPVANAERAAILAAVAFGVGVALFLSARPAAAESWRHAGTELDAKRTVVAEAAEPRPIMVVEFLHQGLVRLNENKSSGGDGIPSGNLVVVAKNNRLVPARILQLGPGDLCRLAFETIAGQNSYDIFYGGRPPKAELLPKWTNTDGLLMETRRFARCNLWRLDSLRAAFAKAEPIGADYVAGVHHSHNPMNLTPGPFFSRYTGTLHIASGGEYTLWTSSRDCSFALIDDKPVVSAPGRHGPMRRARPGLGKTMHLSAGKHKFEYYHAAVGNDAIMSLVWVQGQAGKKPRPSIVPPSVFRAESVGRAEAGSLTTRAKKLVPDFRYKIAGEVPLPGEPLPLIGVSFQDVSPPGLSAKAKYRWDFGDGQTSDGQTSELRNPAHVYLRPGLYVVSLSVKRGTRTVTTTNRIYVDRPLRTRRSKEKPHKLDDYIPILLGYEAKRLDAASARQLFSAFLWKADILAAEDGKTKKGTDADNDAKTDGNAKEKPRKESRQSRLTREAAQRKAAVEKNRKDEERRAKIQKLLAAAVESARESLAGDANDAIVASRDADVYALARLSATTARSRLGDSPSAFEIWIDAGRRIEQPALKAMCALAAADIAVGDLLRPKLAKPLLQRAAAGLAGGTDAGAAARLDRVWGDYHASLGDGKAARGAYLDAQARLKSGKSHVEKAAWQGARSRSTEQFLKSGDWARAFEELRRWQEEFPADKIDGYLTLLLARRWQGREKFRQALALCEQLMAVNPDSPHADRMLLLGADCAMKLKQPQRAKAMLHSILKDYPGSPLVPAVKKKLAELKGG